MKNATEHAKTLKKLMKALAEKVDIPPVPQRTPIEHVVYGLLLADAGLAQADHAYDRIMKHVVDLNDLRVTDAQEIADVIGVRYPQGLERAERIKTVLHAIYLKSYGMTLPKLEKLGKRDAHVYLDKFDGMTPFASACVCIFSLEAHAVPVDHMLLDRLRLDGVVEPETTLEEAQAFLEHHIAAEDRVNAFYQLRAYAEASVKVSFGARKPRAGRSKSSAAKSKRKPRK